MHWYSVVLENLALRQVVLEVHLVQDFLAELSEVDLGRRYWPASFVAHLIALARVELVHCYLVMMAVLLAEHLAVHLAGRLAVHLMDWAEAVLVNHRLAMMTSPWAARVARVSPSEDSEDYQNCLPAAEVRQEERPMHGLDLRPPVHEVIR